MGGGRPHLLRVQHRSESLLGPAWSRDGGKIAFAQLHGVPSTTVSIRVHDVAKKGVKQLTPAGTGRNLYPARAF